MQKQKNLGLIFGSIFLAIGPIAYFILSNQESITALIPSFFGAPLILIGFFAKERTKKWSNLILSLLLLGGTMPGVIKFFPLFFQGRDYARPLAIKTQAFTAIFALILLILSFYNSFLKKD